MKTSELTGFDLNKAVEKAKNVGHPWRYYGQTIPNYCNEWKDGGPIIERERIATWSVYQNLVLVWMAEYPDTSFVSKGPTPLVAAMRCYVASKLGDEVDIPEELCDQ